VTHKPPPKNKPSGSDESSTGADGDGTTDSNSDGTTSTDGTTDSNSDGTTSTDSTTDSNSDGTTSTDSTTDSNGDGSTTSYDTDSSGTDSALSDSVHTTSNKGEHTAGILGLVGLAAVVGAVIVGATIRRVSAIRVYVSDCATYNTHSHTLYIITETSGNLGPSPQGIDWQAYETLWKLGPTQCCRSPSSSLRTGRRLYSGAGCCLAAKLIIHEPTIH
jgi:hypothetical protein